MKNLTYIIAFLFCACSEEITPIPATPSNTLTIESSQYVEVKIDGFGSVWVNGTERIIVSRGTIKFHACGTDGEFIHDGKSKLVIKCP